MSGKEEELGPEEREPGWGPRGSRSEERQARAAGGPESQGRGQTLEEQERGQSVEGAGVFWKDCSRGRQTRMNRGKG